MIAQVSSTNPLQKTFHQLKIKLKKENLAILEADKGESLLTLPCEEYNFWKMAILLSSLGAQPNQVFTLMYHQ